MHAGVGLLDTDMMPMFMIIALDFQKTFRKPRRVPLMPEEDVELSNHLMTKGCIEASECVVFMNLIL